MTDLRPPAVRPTIPPGVTPGERRITWTQLLGKPATPSAAGITIGLGDLPRNAAAARKFLESDNNHAVAYSLLQLADIPVNATATRKFLESDNSNAVAYALLALADLPVNAVATRKFLMSVSSAAAIWDVLAAGDIPTITTAKLSDYQTGSWTLTDTSGAGLSMTTSDTTYVKIGKFVIAFFSLAYPATADGSAAQLGGLPFTVAAGGNYAGGYVSVTNSSLAFTYSARQATTNFQLVTNAAANITNAQMSNFATRGAIIYQT